MNEYDFDNTSFNDFDDIIDADFDTPYDFSEGVLREDVDKIVTWWEEDYTFEELLEEFDLDTCDAFYALVQTGMIDPEDLVNYLVSE